MLTAEQVRDYDRQSNEEGFKIGPEGRPSFSTLWMNEAQAGIYVDATHALHEAGRRGGFTVSSADGITYELTNRGAKFLLKLEPVIEGATKDPS